MIQDPIKVVIINQIGIYRKRLFNMINDLPTIFEVVSGNTKKQTKMANHSNNNKSKSNTKGV